MLRRGLCGLRLTAERKRAERESIEDRWRVCGVREGPRDQTLVATAIWRGGERVGGGVVSSPFLARGEEGKGQPCAAVVERGETEVED